MIARPPLPAGPFVVVGLARSGVAVALALRARGAEVVGCDAGTVSDDVRAELEGAGVRVAAPSDGLGLLARASTVIKSPGVPREAPIVAVALREGLRVLGELEIGWRLLGNDFVAVTGSNGKTTTAELIGHIHRTAGRAVTVAGNVGTALTTLTGTIDPAAVVVCEASSFQLEDTEAFAPDAAVLLNIVEDHLDRHGTLAAYRRAKLRAFGRQPAGTIAVAPPDLVDDLGGEGTRITFGAGGDLDHRDGRLWWHSEPLLATSDIRLRGAHNRENAMAAAAVCLARGVEPAAVREALATVAGVPHRLEEVADRGGVLWVNDSKATNVASTLVALRSFAGGVHVILGGQGKGQDFTPLAPVVADRCVAVHLIGEAAGELREVLAGTAVPLHDSGDLATAVARAGSEAEPGEVVLLSPACASFDQFRDFEARGEAFRSLVEAPA
jgi:UDP-N-acetylmuramoylalanine--D-glutamate ligase